MGSSEVPGRGLGRIGGLGEEGAPGSPLAPSWSPQGPVRRRRPPQSAPGSAVRPGLPGEPGMPDEGSPASSSPTHLRLSEADSRSCPCGRSQTPSPLRWGDTGPTCFTGFGAGLNTWCLTRQMKTFPRCVGLVPSFCWEVVASPLLRATDITGNRGGGECSAVIREPVSLVQFQV